MLVNYCDLCGVPLKENNYYHLYIASSHDKRYFNKIDDYYDYLDEIKKDVKEICSNCNLVIDEIFRLRFNNLAEISKELLGIYELSSEPKKGKRNGKEKKN